MAGRRVVLAEGEPTGERAARGFDADSHDVVQFD
jgi:hypothetical protein